MTDHPTTPHDALVKKLLEAPERAGVVLREYLPAAVCGKLADTDPEPDPATPVQLLGYLQRIWRRYAEQNRDGRAHRYRHLPHEPQVASRLDCCAYM